MITMRLPIMSEVNVSSIIEIAKNYGLVYDGKDEANDLFLYFKNNLDESQYGQLCNSVCTIAALVANPNEYICEIYQNI